MKTSSLRTKSRISILQQLAGLQHSAVTAAESRPEIAALFFALSCTEHRPSSRQHFILTLLYAAWCAVLTVMSSIDVYILTYILDRLSAIDLGTGAHQKTHEHLGRSRAGTLRHGC